MRQTRRGRCSGRGVRDAEQAKPNNMTSEPVLRHLHPLSPLRDAVRAFRLH